MKRYWKYLVSILIIMSVIGGYLFYFCTYPKEIEETIIEINSGETALSIANKLYNKNLIISREAFYLYIKLTKSQGSLSYGKYLFKGNLNMINIINLIKSGKVLLKKITIPEGLTAWKTCKLLAKRGFGKYKVLLALCNDSLFAKKMTGFSIPNLEGFLYPETYFFPDDVTEEFIISHIVKEFFNQTADLDFKPNKNLDFYEIIILASIVEREAKIEDEKPTIASVYVNRINYNYKLQADPTVAYVLELAGKNREKLFYKDLEIDSPYNTYKHLGLPPTPICSPARSSIAAVLNPAETDYFFFFANGQGRHEFTKTYQQHLFKQNQLKASNGN
ncbi:MAG: endolytic transglycosylase MltG [Candidatus Cloacimonadales bacterium]|nr:endolytic transglycosylase MltG [Candidatus Cloacimonadales bacterium]